jgi:hypothetical protein
VIEPRAAASSREQPRVKDPPPGHPGSTCRQNHAWWALRPAAAAATILALTPRESGSAASLQRPQCSRRVNLAAPRAVGIGAPGPRGRVVASEQDATSGQDTAPRQDTNPGDGPQDTTPGTARGARRLEECAQ